MNTEQKKSTKPIEMLRWVAVAFLIASLAWVIGQKVSHLHESSMSWFVKGLLVLLASGYAGSLITGWFRKAIRGQ